MSYVNAVWYRHAYPLALFTAIDRRMHKSEWTKEPVPFIESKLFNMTYTFMPFNENSVCLEFQITIDKVTKVHRQLYGPDINTLKALIWQTNAIDEKLNSMFHEEMPCDIIVEREHLCDIAMSLVLYNFIYGDPFLEQMLVHVNEEDIAITAKMVTVGVIGIFIRGKNELLLDSEEIKFIHKQMEFEPGYYEICDWITASFWRWVELSQNLAHL